MAARSLRLGRQKSEAPFELPAHHLVTHGVVLGMTGSGKTGLTVVLVEEALRAGVPVLAIDIKGDLPNLLLTFPELSSAEFLPWIDAEAAARAGRTGEQVASELSEKWRAGLAASGLSAGDVAALRARTVPRLFTPGAKIGEPVDVLSALSRRSPLWDQDEELAEEQLSSGVSLLLRLAGRDGDTRSREHVVLSALAARRLRAGEAAPIAALLADLLAPPVASIGAMAFEEFLPPKDQQALAQDLNTLVASTKLRTWLSGAPLALADWLAPDPDKSRLSILSVAHLDDDERMLVLGLVLDEILAWVRGLSGTSELRALIVFDEVFGFLPPHPQNPATKKPLLSLLKQARAFGVGLLVATQNPMDLDYKALSNAGAWFIGRLQTDADRARVVEGLTGADGGLGGVSAGELDDTLRNLPGRTFFVRDVHSSPACAVMSTRFTLSFLRGPMTRRELMQFAPKPEPTPASPATPAASPAEPASGRQTSAPSAPVGWHCYWGPAPTTGSRPSYRPFVAATVLIRASDAKLAVSLERSTCLVARFDAAGRLDLSSITEIDPRGLSDVAPPDAVCDPLPVLLTTKKGVASVERAMREHASARAVFEVDVLRELALVRAPDESEQAFAQRCIQQAALTEDAGAVAKATTRASKLERELAIAEAELAQARGALATAPSELGTAFLRVALGKSASQPLTKARAKADARLTKAETNARRLAQELLEARSALEVERAAHMQRAQRAPQAIERVRLLPKRGGAEIVAIGVAWSALP